MRAAIEERYAADLAKLSKRTLSDKVDADLIGTVGGLWTELLTTTANVSKARAAMAADIAKFEAAFRTRCDKDPQGEWHKVRQGQSALSANYEADFVRITKDYADKIARVEKLDSKTKKRSGTQQVERKVLDAMTAADTAKLHWEAEATKLFTKFESMDRTRLEYLKTHLAKYAELEGSVLESLSAINIAIVTAFSDFSVEDEILNFCTTKGTANGDRRGSHHGSVHRQDAPSAEMSPNASGTFNARNTSTSLHEDKQHTQQQPSIDEEGFSVRPDDTADPFKIAAKPGDDDSDDEQPTQQKLKVAIKDHAIVESGQAAQADILSIAAKLPPPTTAGRTLNQRTRTRTQSTGPGVLGSPVSEKSVQLPTSGLGMLASSPDSMGVWVDATIHETVNVLQAAGQVDKILVTGEILMQVPNPAERLNLASMLATIRVQNFAALQQIVPNEAFVSASPHGAPDEFVLDLGLLALQGPAPTALFKYQVLTQSPADCAPISVRPMWKCDEKQASLLLSYEPNAPLLARLPVHDISLLASISGGGEIGSVQTKPTGAWDLDSRCIEWQLGEADLLGESPDGGAHRILARIETSETCTPNVVVVRFESRGTTLSGIDVDVVGGPAATPPSEHIRLLRSAHKLVSSGKFGAQAELVPA
ncbi:hypothetical protein HK105_203008 [Polyrhizophydium stewartii]|uniref:MHD domain-containing protein n=1 Tax=Polyrhizophydium stewartii TaxID=2732419 RepID=A0ABR4ND36_9FUNG